MSESRRDYMREEGFVLVDDVFHQFMDTAPSAVNTSRLPDIVPSWWHANDPSDSVGGLALVTRQLCDSITGLPNPRKIDAGYGVTREELAKDRNKFIARGGFDDVSFTWHFAPGVANAVVQTFVDEGYVTYEQYTNLTFGDWADLIGSSWFSNLMHDMALTNNGKYGEFGLYPSQYPEGSLKDSLGIGVDSRYTKYDYGSTSDFKLFDVRSVYEPDTDQTHLAASTTSDFRRWLRRSMRITNSPGCPVARHAGSLSLELADTNPHAQGLIARGDLEVIDRDEEQGRIRFVQEYTPIDRALDGFAALLDGYDQAYGTPYVSLGGIEHRSLPRTGILLHHGNESFSR